MDQMIWINNKVMPLRDATISVEDRGFQFADGVYEVVRIYARQPFELAAHLTRLENSCRGIELALPYTSAQLADSIRDFVRQHGPDEAMVYLQATRGVAPRNHQFPSPGSSTVLFYTRPLAAPAEVGAGPGAKLLCVPDERWQRCWIKSIALLANVLVKNQALSRGYDEALFVENGHVSEGSASNVFVVKNGELITSPPGPKVLGGITRQSVILLAEQLAINVHQRQPTLNELLEADEVFITATTRQLSWVSHCDQHPIGQNRCGDVTRRLHQAYRDRIAGEIENQTVAKV